MQVLNIYSNLFLRLKKRKVDTKSENYTVNVPRSHFRSAKSPLKRVSIDVYGALALPNQCHFIKVLSIVDSKTSFVVLTPLSSGTWVNMRNAVFRS